MRTIRIRTDYAGILILRELITYHLEHEIAGGTAAGMIITSLLHAQLNRLGKMGKTTVDRNHFNIEMHDAICLQLVLTSARFRLLKTQTQPLTMAYTVELETQIEKQL